METSTRLGASARRTAFWALDAARGGPIRSHLDDIRAAMDGEVEPSRRLEPLLEHAIRSTPFYADVDRPSLDAFPVLTRAALQREWESLQATTPEHASAREVNTSGSSGRPVTVRQDRDKRRRSIADTIYVNEKCGQRVGDPLMWMRAWRPETSETGLVRRLQNITTVDVRGLDEEHLGRIVDTLRQRRINALLAYPSTLATLSRYVLAQGLDARDLALSIIINDSEMLAPALKRELEATFGCHVADRYANAENGMLAFAMPGAEAFRLNRASYVFEFLDLEEDRPQPDGEMARVVVTDLFNRAMPLIRYDTGDLAVPILQDGVGPTALERLDGRRADLVEDMAGRLVSSSMVVATMDGFPRLERYQLQQLDAHAFKLRVIDPERSYPVPELTRALLDLLGQGTAISVDRVTDIPAAPSGKFRALVSLAREQPTGPGSAQTADRARETDED
jgi:phenylacetate-CoA ligase